MEEEEEEKEEKKEFTINKKTKASPYHIYLEVLDAVLLLTINSRRQSYVKETLQKKWYAHLSY